MGLGRLVLALALFLFYEAVSKSARVAGLAALLYMANPNFLFFDGMFSYESLSLPFAVLALYAILRRSEGQTRARLGMALAGLLALGVVMVTHHLTAYALAGLLLLWALVSLVPGRRGAERPDLAGTAVFAAVCALAWLVFVANLTVGYLAGNVGGGILALIRLMARETTVRHLYQSNLGQLPPLWEQAAAYGSVACVLALLPFGILHIWRRQRVNARALTLALGALAYPASLALRLTSQGAEASNRASEFLFLAIALVVAFALAELRSPKRPGRGHLLARALPLTIIFVGSLIVGWAPWARLPGAYMVGADMRSVDAQSMAAAGWTAAQLPPDQRIVADRSNALLLGSYGQERPVTAFANHLDVSNLLFAPTLGPAERALLRQGRIQYLLIDHRRSTAPPLIGYYFDPSEPGAFHHTTPLPAAALDKFNGDPAAGRVLDQGTS